MTDLARLIDDYAGRGLSRETWRHYRPVLWAFGGCGRCDVCEARRWLMALIERERVT